MTKKKSSFFLKKLLQNLQEQPASENDFERKIVIN